MTCLSSIKYTPFNASNTYLIRLSMSGVCRCSTGADLRSRPLGVTCDFGRAKWNSSVACRAPVSGCDTGQACRDCCRKRCLACLQGS